MLSEMIRLATLFQNQQMFQAVDQLAPQFLVQRDTVDRSRFNYLTPVNVIPGLHVIDGNVQATTQFDTLSI
jgi:phage tail sheath gpL-like